MAKAKKEILLGAISLAEHLPGWTGTAPPESIEGVRVLAFDDRCARSSLRRPPRVPGRRRHPVTVVSSAHRRRDPPSTASTYASHHCRPGRAARGQAPGRRGQADVTQARTPEALLTPRGGVHSSGGHSHPGAPRGWYSPPGSATQPVKGMPRRILLGRAGSSPGSPARWGQRRPRVPGGCDPKGCRSEPRGDWTPRSRWR